MNIRILIALVLAIFVVLVVNIFIGCNSDLHCPDVYCCKCDPNPDGPIITKESNLVKHYLENQ